MQPGYAVVLFVLVLLSGCALSLSTDDTQAEVKSLSHILQETEVQTCTKITATLSRYAQATTIWAGRTTMEECLKALYPY